jgi:hypothetical protein
MRRVRREMLGGCVLPPVGGRVHHRDEFGELERGPTFSAWCRKSGGGGESESLVGCFTFVNMCMNTHMNLLNIVGAPESEFMNLTVFQWVNSFFKSFF